MIGTRSEEYKAFLAGLKVGDTVVMRDRTGRRWHSLTIAALTKTQGVLVPVSGRKYEQRFTRETGKAHGDGYLYVQELTPEIAASMAEYETRAWAGNMAQRELLSLSPVAIMRVRSLVDELAQEQRNRISSKGE